MKKELTWQEQLKLVLEFEYFGKNIEWELKDISKFISKLEKLGASDIQIIDNESIEFELPAPVNCHDILLFILTSDPKPSTVLHKKKKYNNRLFLEWRY